MARKKKTRYVCQECGYDSLQWLGKCPGCGSWNTMVEEIVPEETQGAGKGGVRLGLSDAQKPQPIAEVETRDLPRFTTGSPELDRVLGGGVIPGSMVLIVGDPGVGKSSLTLAERLVCLQVLNGGTERYGDSVAIFECRKPADIPEFLQIPLSIKERKIVLRDVHP